jgi:hypothetical protein
MKDAATAGDKSSIFWKKHLALADEINDGDTGYAIERALDIARAQAFKPFVPPP